ncbi:MAG TPA: hypothetical protein PKM27_10420 [Saprospiraceae bacterium]|nr:hypothetical protein [Saprospiraceae bacterium]HNT22107.1 hypothetical protein [Saprospiraceae bacterium]
MKPLALKNHFFILLWLIPQMVFAQVELNTTKLTLLEGKFEKGSRIIEFKPSSLIIKVKMKNLNRFTEQEIPAEAIKDITIKYDLSPVRGAMRGLMIGGGLGLLIGSGLYYSGPVGAFVAFAALGTGIGLGAGGKKITRFPINGNLNEYQKNLDEMQRLLILK